MTTHEHYMAAGHHGKGIHAIDINLVGGFNPCEKYARQINWVYLPQIRMNMKKLKPPSSKCIYIYIVYTCSPCCLMLYIQHMRKKQTKMVFVSAGHSPSSLPSCCPGQIKHSKCVRGSGQSSYLTIHCSACCFLRMWGGI